MCHRGVLLLMLLTSPSACGDAESIVDGPVVADGPVVVDGSMADARPIIDAAAPDAPLDVDANVILDAAPPDSGPDADPYCHYDCFGRHECRDGVVTTWLHAPVPCVYWTGQCPHEESYTCERGCRIDTDRLYEPYLPPRVMCEEWRPKQVGDACTEASHCDPQVATWDSQGTVTNVYLRCDLETLMCVPRDPPVVPDYLAPVCGLVLDDEPGYRYGFTTAAACGGGLCLFLERDTCMEQGCTLACDSDDDCPMGSVCQEGWSVCKPGPPYLVGIDLTCP